MIAVNAGSPSYRYCGLTVRSAVELPELPLISAADHADIDVVVAAPSEFPVERSSQPWSGCRGEHVVLRVAGVAAYRISQEGRLIEVLSDSGADAEAVRLFLLHPVFARAAQMRGEFLLNASAVAADGKVTAFTGFSATGKSTAAALLAHQGVCIVSDSLLRIAARQDGQLVAYPQAPWLLLWPDTRERLDLDGRGHYVRPELELRRVPFTAAASALPLTRIAILSEQRGLEAAALGATAVSSSEGVRELFRHTVGASWISGEDRLRRTHLEWAASICRGCRQQRLRLSWQPRHSEEVNISLGSWLLSE